MELNFIAKKSFIRKKILRFREILRNLFSLTSVREQICSGMKKYLFKYLETSKCNKNNRKLLLSLVSAEVKLEFVQISPKTEL